MDLTVQDLKTLINPLLELVHEAGDAICLHYHSVESGAFEAKGDDTPITRADLDSHDILLAGLRASGADIPILSEESTQVSASQRMAWTRYWLVDPLDGTREFLDRTGEFTINIALIEDHKPVLGVLYLPLEKHAYVGIPGTCAHCYECQADGSWARRELSTRPLREMEALTVLASRRHRGPRLAASLQWLEQRRGTLNRKNSGSALKFCQLVEGEGDFYPRFSPCCEWDTAAGQAILEAAGGALIDLAGLPLRYNCTESLYSPDFYALGDANHPLWKELLAEHF